MKLDIPTGPILKDTYESWKLFIESPIYQLLDNNSKKLIKYKFMLYGALLEYGI